MAKDLSHQIWHGIPRKEIPWFPTVNAEQCIGCELCFISCGREVFEISADKFHKASAERPYNCMVGCSTCATICPTEAISFPGRDLIWKVEREHKIFKEVHKEAKVKKEKIATQNARAAAEKKIAQLTTKARFEIAGEFGHKSFLVKLEDLLDQRPYDIVNLTLSVPTLKGAKENAPSFMSFDVTSTEQEDILEFLEEVRTLVHLNGFVLVSENKL